MLTNVVTQLSSNKVNYGRPQTISHRLLPRWTN